MQREEEEFRRWNRRLTQLLHHPIRAPRSEQNSKHFPIRENHPRHTKISATPQKLTCEHRIVLVENCTRRNRLVQTLGSHTRVESTVCKMVRRRETQRLFQLP